MPAKDYRDGVILREKIAMYVEEELAEFDGKPPKKSPARRTLEEKVAAHEAERLEVERRLEAKREVKRERLKKAKADAKAEGEKSPTSDPDINRPQSRLID
jgi:hypothetical protein